MSEKTQTIAGPFHTRRKARKLEREVQAFIESKAGFSRTGRRFYEDIEIPDWANGVRVEKVGLFQYSLVATSHEGH